MSVPDDDGMPDQEYLRECFDYDDATGDLRWKWRPLEHFPDEHCAAWWNARFAGVVAGWTKTAGENGNPFIRVSINGAEFRLNRVIWKWMTGKEPAIVAHKNGNGTDNRWDNLTDDRRVVSDHARVSFRGRRGRYKPRERHGTGVCQMKNGKFRAKISIDNVTISLGSHQTREAAEAAYLEAVKRLKHKQEAA